MTPSSSIRLMISLDLPTLAAHKVIGTFSSRCAPNPTKNSEIPIYAPSTRPFLTDPLAATIVFSITIVGSSGERDYIQMVVHRRALLNLVPLHLLEVATATATSIPWNVWGPPVTRWLTAEVPGLVPQTNMHSYGQRYVELGGLEDIDDEEGNSDEEEGNSDEKEGNREGDDSDNIDVDLAIIICDFNPWRVQDARLHQEKYGVDVRGDQSSVFNVEVVGGGESDVCFANGVFKFDIVGKLPYVQYCRSKWPPYDYVVIDEERLIGVQVSLSIFLDEQA